MGLYSIFANFAHPITPTFIKNLGLNDYMFGVTFASMAITNFLSSPFWGKLSKNLSSAKIMSFAFVGYGIGQAVFGLATTEFGIVLGRMLGGFFVGGIMTNQMIYVINNSDAKNRGTNLAIVATIMSVVSPFGFLIGGFLGDISIPLTFVLQVAGLVSVGILNFIILDDKESNEKLEFKALVKESNPLGIIVEAQGLLNRSLIIFFIIVATTSFATVSYEQCFNFFIKDQFGFPPSYNGLLKAAVGFITLIANSTITILLIKKTNINKSLIYVLTVCMLMMLAIVLIDDIYPFIIINVIFFAFNAIYLPLLQTLLSKFNKDEKDGGVLVGLFNSMRSFGMIFGSLFAGFIYTVGPKLAFVSSAVAFLVAIYFAIMNYRQAKLITI